MPPVSGGDQRRIRPSTGVESDDQARTRGMDPCGTSQPGRELQWSCPDCGGKPGNSPCHSLCGDEKSEIRTFVREKRRREGVVFWGCFWCGGGRVGGWVGVLVEVGLGIGV